MREKPCTLLVRFTEQNGSIGTVEMPFDTESSAQRYVLSMFEDGYFPIVPPAAQQDDGLHSIYIPTSRIVNIHIIEEQEQ